MLQIWTRMCGCCWRSASQQQAEEKFARRNERVSLQKLDSARDAIDAQGKHVVWPSGEDQPERTGEHVHSDSQEAATDAKNRAAAEMIKSQEMSVATVTEAMRTAGAPPDAIANTIREMTAAFVAQRKTMDEEFEKARAFPAGAPELFASGWAPVDTPWVRNGGESLEPSLRVDATHGEAPVRLVDARYLVSLDDRGARLVRRQDVPEQAFLSLERLQGIRGDGIGGMLRVLVVSYPW